MKTQKIALVLAGGVSLGSYEAGVIAELLYALETLNRTADQENRPRYELDVMTGGSAGGMTAVLTTRIMMYDYIGRKDHLYNAWVEDIDIDELLGKSESPINALFSKKTIEDIVHKYVVDDAHLAPTRPASFAPGTLRVSLSLSNMHGTDYVIPYFSLNSPKPEYFVTTFFSEMARFTLRKTDLPSQEDWRHIGRAAIATGNFPVAFKPQRLSPKDILYPTGNRGDSPECCFIDGGLFNNEPLGEAIDLAAEADDHQLDPERLFIVIDPNINKSLSMPEIDPDDKLDKHIKRMVTMIFGESIARDWLRAHRKNTELEWRDQSVRALGQLIRSASFTPDQQFASEFKSVAEAIAREQTMLGKDYDAQNYLRTSIERTFQNPLFQEIDQQLGGSEHGATKQELFRHMVFVLNNVAGLQKKSQIRLALIGAEKEKLAGDAISSFGGFFNKDWRIYDYRIGRETAYLRLPEILGLKQMYPKEKAENGNDDHKDYHIPQEWREKFPNVTSKDFKSGDLDKLRGRILERANCVMQDLEIPWLYRLFLKHFVIKKQLKKHL